MHCVFTMSRSNALRLYARAFPYFCARRFCACLMSKYLFAFFALLPSGQSLKAQVPQAPRSSSEPEYSHQYFFAPEQRYYFVDTSRDNLFWYRQLSASGRDDYASLPLLNLGGPRQNLMAPVIASPYRQMSAGAFQAYFSDPESVPYFITRSPYTEARYWQGYELGQQFSLLHSQNVHRRWNFTLKMFRLNSEGAYANTQNRLYNFLASSHYQSPKGRYQIKGFISSELLRAGESGGLVDRNDVLLNQETTRSLVNMRLLSGRAESDLSQLGQRQFFIEHSWQILGAKAPKVPAAPSDSLGEQGDSSTATEPELISENRANNYLRLQHRFHYERLYQNYQGYNFDFYQNYFQSTEGSYRDSLYYRRLQNEVGLEGRLGSDSSGLVWRGGLSQANYRYGFPDYEFRNFNWGLYSALKGNYRGFFDFDLTGDYVVAGPLSNTFDLQAKAQGGWKQTQAYAGYRLARRFPELIAQHYSGNNFLWFNNFEAFNYNELKAGLRYGKQNFLEWKTYALGNWYYFDAESQAQTIPEVVAYTQLDWRQDFRFFGWLHLNNRLTWQEAISGGEYLPRPRWLSRNALFADFELFGGVLPTVAGIEMLYFSRYEAPSYNPVLSRFYIGNEQAIGDYPLFDFFVQFRLGRAYIFLKLEHLNQGLMGTNDFFAAPYYPFNDRVFRLGVNWRFFN